jgi:hypothetical protein
VISGLWVVASEKQPKFDGALIRAANRMPLSFRGADIEEIREIAKSRSAGA